MDDKTLPNIMEAKNNKETINLLDFLSESESAVSDIVLTPKKKKVKRRYRSGGYSVREKRGDSTCSCGKSQTRIVALWLAAVSITFWLLALSWLAAILYSDIKKMDSNIKSVKAGNDAFPDSLQKYHSATKDLENNQTLIFGNITEIKLELANFTIQLSSIQHGLHEVQNAIRNTPDLISIPNKLLVLSTEVSTWGSKITDLLVTTNESKEIDHRIENVQSTILNNLTAIELKLADLSKVTQQPQAALSNESKAQNEWMRSTIVELIANVTTVNSTLTRNLQWTKEDQEKYHKMLVELQEASRNVTAQVMSLDGECVKMTAQEALKAVVEKLTTDVESVKHIDSKLQTQIQALENSYTLLRNSSESMLASIAGLQNLRSNTTANTSTIPLILNDTEKPKVTPTESPSGTTGEVAAESLDNGGISPEKSLDHIEGASSH